jgi:CheY-like chemotaxis protein
MSTDFEAPSEVTGHILLVDDDLLLLRANAEVLINAGYNINTARDGDEAWKALQNFNYDLMITDQRMPKMTGVELIKKVRSEKIALPIILASGTMPTHELERDPLLRIEALLTKPFTGGRVIERGERSAEGRG